MKTTKDTSIIPGFDDIISLYLRVQTESSKSWSQRPGVSMTSTPGIVDFDDLKPYLTPLPELSTTNFLQRSISTTQLRREHFPTPSSPIATTFFEPEAD